MCGTVGQKMGVAPMRQAPGTQGRAHHSRHFAVIAVQKDGMLFWTLLARESGSGDIDLRWLGRCGRRRG